MRYYHIFAEAIMDNWALSIHQLDCKLCDGQDNFNFVVLRDPF